MEIQQYFPKGIATEQAFCNRVLEQKRLSDNIKANQHTLIMSPRRYGKTSLVRKTLIDSGLIYSEIDLFIAIDAEQIRRQILHGIRSIVQQSCSSLEQAMSLLRESFKGASTKWLIGTTGIQLEIIPEQSDPALSISEALQALEILLIKKKLRAVFFIDEIQEIGEIAEGQGIEGAIRHVAQNTKQLTFIFSGSKRHLIANMFYDRARPLYKLCEHITLERISSEDYIPHLQKIAGKSWKNKLSQKVLDSIFSITALHPYYMNALCLKIWQSTTNGSPDIDCVIGAWQQVVEDEKIETLQDLAALSQNQRRILVAIANGSNKELTGKAFLRKYNMTGSTVYESLSILEQRDYIQKDENLKEYKILDPVMKTTLTIHFKET